MARKRWSAKTEITPDLIKFRDKRKWQIALRRYVLERNASIYYAPYFGLDIDKLRKWLQIQFKEGVTWEDFGKKWQFDHIVPVNYFDFLNDSDLKLCWNFTNIRVNQFQRKRDRGNRLDLLTARNYFSELYKNTNYTICKNLLERIDVIELSKILNTEKQQAFILDNRTYLDKIDNYSSFEFELLNTGRSITDVKKEIEFLKKFDK